MENGWDIDRASTSNTNIRLAALVLGWVLRPWLQHQLTALYPD